MITTSACPAASGAFSWAVPPDSTNGIVESECRDHTPTSIPAPRRRRVIAVPMVPVPMTATFGRGRTFSPLESLISVSSLAFSVAILCVPRGRAPEEGRAHVGADVVATKEPMS